MVDWEKSDSEPLHRPEEPIGEGKQEKDEQQRREKNRHSLMHSRLRSIEWILLRI